MTIVGLLMLLVFGGLAVRHFVNGRYVWGVVAALGSLLGAGSLWADYQRANRAAETAAVSRKKDGAVFGDYKPSR